MSVWWSRVNERHLMTLRVDTTNTSVEATTLKLDVVDVTAEPTQQVREANATACVWLRAVMCVCVFVYV